MGKMPFKVSLTARVSSLAAGEKQKVEILKQLSLQNRILILDEPTSVLTPQEADEMLGHLRAMTLAQQVSVLIITHKLREVAAFADGADGPADGRDDGGIGSDGQAEATNPAIEKSSKAHSAGHPSP
jgi:simple sugar transport system ATP-binding protein